MDFELELEAGVTQSQSELLPFSSNACATQTPPAVAPGKPNQQELLADTLPILPTYATGLYCDRIPHPRLAKCASQKNRLVPPMPPTTGPQKPSQSKKNRDRLYQIKQRLRDRKKKALSDEDAVEAINLITANATPPFNFASCRPAKAPPPCACPLCPRRFQRPGLIHHL